jgi:hypothetical protein
MIFNLKFHTSATTLLEPYGIKARIQQPLQPIQQKPLPLNPGRACRMINLAV